MLWRTAQQSRYLKSRDLINPFCHCDLQRNGNTRPRFKYSTYLLNIVVLAQKRVGAVGDTHGDDSHGADHDHGDVHVGEHGHDRSAQRKTQRAQDVDHFYTKVVVVQVFLQQGCGDRE